MSSQWSQGVIQPPEGVTPNFVDPPNQIEQSIPVHVVFLTLTTLCVAMRLYTRVHVSRVGLGIDDYLCIFSYAATVTWTAVLFEAFRWGIGRHIWDEPAVWLVSALKYQTIASQIYTIASTAIKLSLLFLYRRLFNLKTKPITRAAINGGIVVVFLFNLGLFLGIVFFCIPVQKAWDNSLDGHCSSPAPLSYLSGVWNVVVDIYILVLPIPLVWDLNMSLKRKLRLIAVFGVGFFACVSSLVRLAMTPILQSDTDSTYNIARVSIFSTLEINVGLECSCLMLLPAFLRHHLPESTKSYLRSFSFSRPKFSKDSNSNHARWQGYRHRVGSEPQTPDPTEDKRIARTDTFTIETFHVPVDFETGKKYRMDNSFSPSV
ncbi:hypothetical protein F5B21DRAFT_488212 [Xylaria acuta]|nr:hypothetical protein F5B21DRAFT_488212 [Xylaria acuta]